MLVRIRITSTLVLGVSSQKVNVDAISSAHPDFKFLGRDYVEKRWRNNFGDTTLDSIVLRLRLSQSSHDCFTDVLNYFSECDFSCATLRS